MLKLKSINFSYTEKGELFTVSTKRSVRNDRMFFEVETDGNTFSAVIHTDNEIQINNISATFEYPFMSAEKIFLNGYQSWTDSIEHPISDSMRGLKYTPKHYLEQYALTQYGDYNFTDYPFTPGEMHGWTYGYVRHENEYDFFGSLDERSGFTKILTSIRRNEITFVRDCKDHTINSDYTGLKLIICTGSEDTVFDRYFELLGIKPRAAAKPVMGYTSWYRHYQNISSEILTADLNALAEQKYKSDIFQIDDGWQTKVGDWLSVDTEKFPEGMAEMAAKIREKGLIPGLWLAPFVCEKDSEVFRRFEPWLLKDADRNYVKGGSNWSGFYVFDIYNKEFRSYLRKVFDTVTKEWGFGFLKLDFLYAACIEPRQDKTRGQVMADAMDFLREISNGALLLGCGVPLGSAFGKVDYCRIGCDVSLDWDDKSYMKMMHRERISTKNSILNSVFRRQLNGRAFYNDPDVYILRDTGTELTDAQKQCLAEINAMNGGVLFTSDNMNSYDEITQKIFSRIMALRNSKVISAELIDKHLIVKFTIGERKFIRKYKI